MSSMNVVTNRARAPGSAATALGRGQAASWPMSEARAGLGLLADLFTRDQDVSAAKTRAALGLGTRLYLHRQIPQVVLIRPPSMM